MLALSKSIEPFRPSTGVCAPVPQGVLGSSLSVVQSVSLYMPKSVELVRFSMLRVLAGVVEPSAGGLVELDC